MKVTLYTKEDCGLCHDAEDMLRRLQDVIPFEIELVDVDMHGEAQTFSDRVPVIVVDGREVAAAPLDERRIRLALSR